MAGSRKTSTIKTSYSQGSSVSNDRLVWDGKLVSRTSDPELKVSDCVATLVASLSWHPLRAYAVPEKWQMSRSPSFQDDTHENSDFWDCEGLQLEFAGLLEVIHHESQSWPLLCNYV